MPKKLKQRSYQLPKVINYGAFQSYSQKPYSHIKPGKEDKKEHVKYDRTVRKLDKFQYLDFNKTLTSLYQKTIDKNTKKKQYENLKLYRRGTGLQMKRNDLLDNIKKQKENLAKNPKPRRTSMNSHLPYYAVPCIGVTEDAGTIKPKKQMPKLKTGTEHWQTTNQYNQGCRPFTAEGKPYSCRGERPKWTFHKPGFVSNTKTARSEYISKFGQLGFDPSSLMPKTLDKHPTKDDGLKDGTSQNTLHIPGYAGFLPTARTHSNATKQAKGKNLRTTIIKTNMLDNFFREIPGYAGFKPRSMRNKPKFQ